MGPLVLAALIAAGATVAKGGMDMYSAHKLSKRRGRGGQSGFGAMLGALTQGGNNFANLFANYQPQMAPPSAPPPLGSMQQPRLSVGGPQVMPGAPMQGLSNFQQGPGAGGQQLPWDNKWQHLLNYMG